MFWFYNLPIYQGPLMSVLVNIYVHCWQRTPRFCFYIASSLPHPDNSDDEVRSKFPAAAQLDVVGSTAIFKRQHQEGEEGESTSTDTYTPSSKLNPQISTTHSFLSPPRTPVMYTTSIPSRRQQPSVYLITQSQQSASLRCVVMHNFGVINPLLVVVVWCAPV